MPYYPENSNNSHSDLEDHLIKQVLRVIILSGMCRLEEEKPFSTHLASIENPITPRFFGICSYSLQVTTMKNKEQSIGNNQIMLKLLRNVSYKIKILILEMVTELH